MLTREDSDGLYKSVGRTVLLLLLLLLLASEKDDEMEMAAGSVAIWEPLRVRLRLRSCSGQPLEGEGRSLAWFNRLVESAVVVMLPALLLVRPLLIIIEPEPEAREPEAIEDGAEGNNSRSPPCALEPLGLELLEHHDELEPIAGAELKEPGPGPGQLGPDIAPLLVLKYLFTLGEAPPVPVPGSEDDTSDKLLIGDDGFE